MNATIWIGSGWLSFGTQLEVREANRGYMKNDKATLAEGIASALARANQRKNTIKEMGVRGDYVTPPLHTVHTTPPQGYICDAHLSPGLFSCFPIRERIGQQTARYSASQQKQEY